jgi:hypothetical protein
MKKKSCSWPSTYFLSQEFEAELELSLRLANEKNNGILSMKTRLWLVLLISHGVSILY